MSYAAVAAENAPPLSQQPHPDPALLNTTPPTHSNVADDSLKINVVSPDFKQHPRTLTSEASTEGDHGPTNSDKNHPDQAPEESQNVWDITKDYLFRPGVAGGLIGIMNLGVFVTIGRTFYIRPELRRNATAISSVIFASFALFSVEGYAAEMYRRTPRGKEEERKAKREGAVIYRHLQEQIVRPNVLGGIVGAVNAVILGALGYVAYSNWNKPWDRRVVSAVSIGLLTVWGGEGILADRLSKE